MDSNIMGEFGIRKTIPIINGNKPRKVWDLDNENDCQELGINPHADLKIADRYVHYLHCKHAVIEFSSTLHKAVEQIESTTKRLIPLGKAIDFLIIVVNRLNCTESTI